MYWMQGRAEAAADGKIALGTGAPAGSFRHSTCVHIRSAATPLRCGKGMPATAMSRSADGLQAALRSMILLLICMDHVDRIHGEFDSISPADV
jgi:hypothetical protein